MITKTHETNGKNSIALYSSDMLYRYSLTRVWQADQPNLLFIMLNPSTATELKNDPTVERCERRAIELGYGSFRVCNIFALRSTDPKGLYQCEDPNGPDNNRTILEGCEWADEIICAWGTHGALQNRSEGVFNLIHAKHNNKMKVLCLTKEGYPKHPLYISYATKPVKWVK